MRRPETARPERRGTPRKRVRYKIRFWNDEIDSSGFTTDVSEAGLFVETRKPAPPGTRLHVEVETAEGPVLAECEVCRVVRVSATVASVAHSGMGVRIIPLREALGFVARPEPELVDLSVDLTEQARLEAFVAGELRTGGLFVETDAVLEMGCDVPLILQLPAPFVAIEATATVVHLSEKPKGIGLQVVAAKALRERLQALATPVGPGRDQANRVVRIDEDVGIGSELRLEVVSRGRRAEAECVVKKLLLIGEAPPPAASEPSGSSALAPPPPAASEPSGSSALAPPPPAAPEPSGSSALAPPPPAAFEPSGSSALAPPPPAASEPSGSSALAPPPPAASGPSGSSALAPPPPAAFEPRPGRSEVPPPSGVESRLDARPEAIPLPSFETADPAIAPELAIGPHRRNDDVTVKVDAQDPEAFRRLYETDIVRGGLFVPTTVHADLQTRVIIQMVLPEPFEPIELESFVVHQSPDPPGFGVQLANLDDVRSKIEPILRRLAGV